MTVFHPKSWLTEMPKGARFYASKADLRVEHPNLSEKEIVSAVYSGPTDDKHLVHKPTPPALRKTAVDIKSIAEAKAILDAAPVPTEDRKMVTPEGEVIPKEETPAPAEEPQSVPEAKPAKKPRQHGKKSTSA